MSIIIKAHFDGKAIVPDTEVDLPADLPLEVEVRFLSPGGKTKAASKTPRGRNSRLTSLPFFGMWADREDMRDSVEWVRKQRQAWSSRLCGED